MKKIVMLMAFFAAGMVANAEEVYENDTAVAPLTVMGDETNEGGVKIANGKDEDDRWSVHVNVGTDIPVDVSDGVDFAPLRSWEIGLTAIQYDYTPKNSKTTLSAGFGLTFRNYTLSGHDQMFAKVGDKLLVGQREGKVSDLSSSIYTMGLSMPLLAKQRFSKNFAVSLGAQVNWYTYARVNNNYEIGDDDFDVNTKKIGHRPLTVDVLGILHFGSVGVYCKYSPMSVLKKERGPEFKSLAVGVYF
jgi:hypothetical protein